MGMYVVLKTSSGEEGHSLLVSLELLNLWNGKRYPYFAKADKPLDRADEKVQTLFLAERS